MSRVAEPSEREKALADRTTILRPAPPAALTRLQLTPEEGFLLSRLDRPQKLSELLAASGLPEARALQVLLALVTKGAVLLPGDAEPARGAKAGGSSPWGEFIFNPGELREDVDLDEEKKKLILFLHAQLGKVSHFRLLGVSPLASSAEVRKAFLERSKQFHPDNFFRRNLGSYAPKVSLLFQRMKAAADTLMDPEARRRYERESSKVFTAEEQAALVHREIEVLEEEGRAKSRRERLLHARGFARLTKARELVAEADGHLGAGEVAAATEKYNLALELDPRLDEARVKLVEARRVAQARRADFAVDEAERAMVEGRDERAVELLRGASELDPQNGRAHLALAKVLVQRGGDWKEVRLHAQRAVELGEPGTLARLLYGEALLELGLKKNARRELEAVHAAGDERAKALLKRC